MSLSSPILSFPRLGLARTLLASLVATAACSGGGTDPEGTAGRLVTAGLATTWVYQYDDARTEPLLSGGPIVADTLRLAGDATGRWSITYLDVLDGTTRRRNEVIVLWNVFAGGDSLHVVPTCGPPTELCDPLPPWVGTITETGSLLLQSTVPSAGRRTRSYMRVNP